MGGRAQRELRLSIHAPNHSLSLAAETQPSHMLLRVQGHVGPKACWHYCLLEMPGGGVVRQGFLEERGLDLSFGRWDNTWTDGRSI